MMLNDSPTTGSRCSKQICHTCYAICCFQAIAYLKERFFCVLRPIYSHESHQQIECEHSNISVDQLFLINACQPYLFATINFNYDSNWPWSCSYYVQVVGLIFSLVPIRGKRFLKIENAGYL